MSKKLKIAVLIVAIGCMVAGSVVFFLKGISKENEKEEIGEIKAEIKGMSICI